MLKTANAEFNTGMITVDVFDYHILPNSNVVTLVHEINKAQIDKRMHVLLLGREFVNRHPLNKNLF